MMLDISPNVVLLSGVVGSTAYGLAGPDSDEDRLGMYAAPTIQFHGLHPPVAKAASIVKTEPDFTLHEAGKFAKLCLGGNPTVMELLWLPEYEVITALGKDLITIRSSFLSARKVRDSYLGYATQQFARLERRGDGSFSADTRKRTAKHARHLMRLCHQGFILYVSGRLVIKLDQPEVFRNFGEVVAGGEDGIEVARDMINSYEEKFDSAV
jgi:predicted nucleotidyltransferase